MSLPTVAEWRETTRAWAGDDASGLPDLIIDNALRAVVRSISGETSSWKFRERTITVIVASGATEFDATAGGATVEPLAIWLGKRLLTPGQHPELRDRWAEATGAPEAWSLWAGKCHLWPAPSTPVTLTVEGYQPLGAWYDRTSPALIAASRPDLPEDFEEAIAEWLLMTRYLHENDTEQANNHRGLHEAALARAADQISRKRPSAHSDVVGGGRVPPNHMSVTIGSGRFFGEIVDPNA